MQDPYIIARPTCSESFIQNHRYVVDERKTQDSPSSIGREVIRKRRDEAGRGQPTTNAKASYTTRIARVRERDVPPKFAVPPPNLSLSILESKCQSSTCLKYLP